MRKLTKRRDRGYVHAKAWAGIGDDMNGNNSRLRGAGAPPKSPSAAAVSFHGLKPIVIKRPYKSTPACAQILPISPHQNLLVHLAHLSLRASLLTTYHQEVA